MLFRSGFRVLIANGLVLAGIGWMCLLGTQQRAAAVLPPLADKDVSALEDHAALSPDAASIARLATAYLDRDQPGLASAVIDRSPAELRERPEIAQLQARALFGRGRASEALAVAKGARDSCSDEVTGRIGCAPWLVAKTTRQLAFLEEVVAAGIEDPYADPDATLAAYERSVREVRLVAMR